MEISRNIMFYLAFMLAGVICQTPPIWGGNLQYSVNVTMTNNDPVMKWNFRYYYNWNLKA